jgi:hypothetical protein
MRPEGGVGVVLPRRNRRFTAAGTADSGRLFQQPRGDLSQDPRGKMERGKRDFYRRERASNRAGNHQD